jgi:hypothetical protein
MHVEIPEDCSAEELKQIEKVLEESIANSVGLNPENVQVVVDPETSEAKYVISSDDPTLAEETQKVLKNDDFVQNINKAIEQNSKNLPAKIRVIFFFSLKKSKQTKNRKSNFFKINFHHVAKTPTKFIE